MKVQVIIHAASLRATKNMVGPNGLAELMSSGVVDNSSGKMSRALSSRHTYIGCFSFTHKSVLFVCLVFLLFFGAVIRWSVYVLHVRSTTLHDWHPAVTTYYVCEKRQHVSLLLAVGSELVVTIRKQPGPHASINECIGCHPRWFLPPARSNSLRVPVVSLQNRTPLRAHVGNAPHVSSW